MRFFLWGASLTICLLGSQILHAQAAKSPAHRGKIVGEEVQIYQKPDFDSPVIATVEAGGIYDISNVTFNNAFYKIRLKPGVLGYVADSDIKPLFKTTNVPSKDGKKPKKKTVSKRNKTFEFTRFGGLTYAMIDFMEETMGGKPHENLGFIGAKISGPNVLLDGLLPIDVNLLFYSGAPSYYKKATGLSADGFIFLADILFQTYWPQSQNTLTYFGFGPMFKYSKFDVAVHDNSTGKDQPFSAEDMSVGAAFGAGVGLRMGSLALRVDYQYFWEKQMYGGFSGALQWAF